jgi:pyruvate dehydrogenase E2 component (dihydrolipoamide acetyltransferase)
MLKEISVPDIGSYQNVPVIEILVAVGDAIEKDTSLVTLETDKATMEVPAPFAGVVKTIRVKVGDKVSEGDVILSIEVEVKEGVNNEAIKEKEGKAAESAKNEPTKKAEAPLSNSKVEKLATEKTEKPLTTKPESAQSQPTTERSSTAQNETTSSSGIAHASPGVRRFARLLGADISRVTGSGPKNRILKTDVQMYVKNELTRSQSGGTGGSGFGASIPPWPQVDFAKFGEITKEPLSRIKKLSGSYLHRNWVMVPHITQFDEADITTLEQFRKDQQALAEQQQVKLTLLPFIMKAITTTLRAFPTFNASLDASGSELILKKYFHIGVAVDTPNGLVVPVVRDVEQKGLFQLAKELGEISSKARAGQLSGPDMQGSSFSISSLGGIGGTAFTPIINVPDVAILGVSKAQIKPVFEEGEFKPRLILPLSLSYDHRVIDGAEGARFITYLVKQLSDIRRLLL